MPEMGRHLPAESCSVDGGGAKNGVWFRAWDPVSQQVVVNESSLVYLDAVVATAKKWGVKLVLTVGVDATCFCPLTHAAHRSAPLTGTLQLTNNWRDFGGMDQVRAACHSLQNSAPDRDYALRELQNECM
jgi:hypothetical protein